MWCRERAAMCCFPRGVCLRKNAPASGWGAFAGEEVRRLPRHQAVGVLLPAVDGRPFDGEQLFLSHFTGDGAWAEPPMELMPALLSSCSAMSAATSAASFGAVVRGARGTGRRSTP